MCGGRRIRTFVAEATDLQSVPFDRSGIPPVVVSGFAISKIEAKYLNPKKTEPPIGIEPMTYWLQVSCSTSWAKEAYIYFAFTLSKRYVAFDNGAQK